MRLLRALAISASLLLAGCGPKSIVSTLFPEKHTVSSTVTFDDAGRRTTQTIRYHCKIIDQTDSIAANIARESEGEAHWLKRSDGRVLVLSPLESCDVGRRKVGDTRAIDPEGIARDAESFVFDDAVRPVEIRVLSTRALFEGPEPRIASARIKLVKTAPATYTLAAAFPGLATLTEPLPPDADKRATPGATFAGVLARVYELTPNSTCETDAKGPGPIQLPVGHACQFLNPCKGAGGRTSRCGREVGYLPVRFDRKWSRAEITLGEADEREIAVLHRKTTMLADGAPSTPGYQTTFWTPEACLDGLCIPIGGHNAVPIRVYYPERGILVDVSITQRAFWPTVFNR